MISIRPSELLITDGTGLTFSLFGKYQNISLYSQSVLRELLSQVHNTVDAEFTLLQPTAITGKGAMEIDTILVANTTGSDISFTLWHTATTTSDDTCIFTSEVKAGESMSITFDDSQEKSTVKIPVAIGEELSTTGENLIFSIYGKYEYIRYRELLFQGEATSAIFEFAIDDCVVESIFVYNPTGRDIDFALLLEIKEILMTSCKACESAVINWTVSEASGGGEWGTINGTLSNQTDLQNALDAKLDAKSAHKIYLFNNLGRVL